VVEETRRSDSPRHMPFRRFLKQNHGSLMQTSAKENRGLRADTEKRQRNQGKFFGSLTPPLPAPTRTTFRFTPHRPVRRVSRAGDTWQPRKTSLPNTGSGSGQRRVRGRCAWQGCSAAAAAAARVQIGLAPLLQEREVSFRCFPLKLPEIPWASLGVSTLAMPTASWLVRASFCALPPVFSAGPDLFFQLRVAEASTRFATKRRSVRPRAWCRSWIESGSWARALAPRRRQT
jgi:hypothetical protein